MRQIEPTIIRKGESIVWERGFCDHPSDEWTLQYRFRGGGPGFDVNATAGPGTSFTATISAVQSALPEPGKYQWQAWATNIADMTIKEVVAAGFVNVKPGFVEGETGDIDLRTPEKIALDAINAALRNAATSDQLEYEVSTPAGSRRVKRMSRAELINLQKHFAAIVSRQNHAEGMRNGAKFAKPVKVSMSSK